MVCGNSMSDFSSSMSRRSRFGTSPLFGAAEPPELVASSGRSKDWGEIPGILGSPGWFKLVWLSKNRTHILWMITNDQHFPHSHCHKLEVNMSIPHFQTNSYFWISDPISFASSSGVRFQKHFRCRWTDLREAAVVVVSSRAMLSSESIPGFYRTNGLPSGNGWHSYWNWPFIVDLPIKNGDFP